MSSFNYKGLKAVKTIHIVSEEEVTERLEQIRQGSPKVINVTDRAAINGDELIIDYAGFVGEEQFAGGTAQRQPLTLGSGTFIPGFEEQLLGAQLGSQVDVHVTFPEVYHAEDLAGKEAVFHCTVHEIHEKGMHDMDDSFAQAVANLPTLAEMRQVLKNYMQETEDQKSYNSLVDELLSLLVAECGDMEVSEEAIERETDNIMAGMDQQMQQQGISLNDYLAYTGRSLEQLRADQRPQAEYSARISTALDMVAQAEGITATDEDMETEFDNIAQQCGISVEQVKSFFGEDSIDAVRHEICQKKAVAVVMSSAELSTNEV